MRILVDTNVIIPLEDSAYVLESSLGKLARLSSENGHQLIVHPSSLDDIKRDKNISRREISLSRIQKYPLLDDPPRSDSKEIEKLGLTQADDNDRVDNDILYSVYRDAVNILVTQDRKLHTKASQIGISDRVHYIQQAVDFLERLYSRTQILLPNIEEMPLHKIDIKSEFFDSLRNNYEGFDKWYRDKAREGRTCWVHRDDLGNPGAIVIYKGESNPIVSDDNRALRGRALKLCTFKVSESIRGRKIGELFLKAAFRFATTNRYENIYITMRPEKQVFLEDLCTDFGFEFFGSYKGDNVFVKSHPIVAPIKDCPALEYHRRYYPHFRCDENINKFIVPIRPGFHKILFPDIQSQASLFGNSSVGNAIKQAYLCHSRIGSIAPGDILLFYRSQDDRVITSIGIVELTTESKDHDKILQLVSKRTVYSYHDIMEMSKKKTKVILFRLAMHIPTPVSYDWLLKYGGVNGQIQTIRKISERTFQRIIIRSGIGDRLFADKAKIRESNS